MLPVRWPLLLLLPLLSACSDLFQGPPAGDDDDDDDDDDATTDGSLPTPSANLPLPDSSCTTGRKVRVTYVYDGDTFELSTWDSDTGDYEHVRLIGIDTPETSYVDEPECYGLEAKEQTRVLVDGREACLTYDPVVASKYDNVDAYDRTLGYLFFGEGYGRFLNAELLIGGFAEDYPYTKGAVFEDYFYDLEAWAKDQPVGRWASCEDSEKH